MRLSGTPLAHCKLAEVEAKLAKYQRLFKTRLPLADRVALHERIARKADSNPFAAMRALERVYELDGILTVKDRAKERAAPPALQPMFILPPGAKITMCGSPAIDVAPERPAIDVAREPAETDD